MGISVSWLASNTPERREERRGVSRRSVTMWESGDVPVPEDVATLILQIRERWLNWIQGCIEASFDTIGRFAEDIEPKESITDLYRYKSDQDLWLAHPSFRGLPATHHAAGLARIRDAIEGETGMPITIRYAARSIHHKHN